MWFTASLATAAPVATPAVVQTIIEDRQGGVTAAVNRLAGGIISYVRWPMRNAGGSLSACTVGQPSLTNMVRPQTPGGEPAVTSALATVASIVAGQPCDIIYLGRIPLTDRRRLIDWIRDRPVLTFTDNDPECLTGAAFCVNRQSGGLTFALNIDAVARSKLVVDPRVLELGRNRSVRP